MSDAAVRSGADGAAGTAVSMVTDKAADAALRLPAASVALAVMLWTPSASVEAVMVHCPARVAMPVPITVVPSNRVTVLPASAVPVKVGVVTLVMLSVLDAPLSEAATRSGIGRGGATVGVDGDRQGCRCGAEVAGHIRRRGGDAVGSGRQGRGRGDGPLPGRRRRRCRPRSCRRRGSPCCRPRPCR